MLAEIERIRRDLHAAAPDRVAACVGGSWQDGVLHLGYWGRPVRIGWPDLEPRGDDGKPLSAFDQAMLLYHLRQSDGTLPADRWISYRDLPGGEFYHQAYQGYTGRRLAEAFGGDPERFDAAAAPNGERLDGPAPHAWSYAPLPRIALAACLWPGDDEMPSQASVLFDANAGHHLPIDGLALLGAGLTGRLLRARPQVASPVRSAH
ncbi:MAG: hypothetical protein HW375_1179 [Anaerolineales bacterium]|nr:hypothetical protein [Anaerolineales bacterium]